jgi:hypothetical protein
MFRDRKSYYQVQERETKKSIYMTEVGEGKTKGIKTDNK